MTPEQIADFVSDVSDLAETLKALVAKWLPFEALLDDLPMEVKDRVEAIMSSVPYMDCKL